MQNKLLHLTRLKQEKDAVILAHYYAPAEAQQAADYIGDSFYLSKLATTLPQKTLVLAGVHFMGESAKALNPEKTVLMPDLSADCPMAHMATPETVAAVRARHEDLAVVCYINSTTALKCCSDVCVTSANAVKVVKALPQKNILFIPDRNLARHVAAQVPEKNFIFHDGYCPIHNSITPQNILEAKALHPDSPVLAHPECTAEVLALADRIGSTSEIITFAEQSSASSFIICTEEGVLHQLKERCPEKQFYSAVKGFVCPDMKLNTLDKLIECLETGCGEVTLSQEQIHQTGLPLSEMLRLAR